ncbi:hypothetical protein E2C01_036401 [Portunus trituberculatus]|uniref:Uncharacterized protein n=1 Tax=Portunus trituberculatus TaxID=210409 RepID=A0A5B7FBY7_PORTR|nr:hypothetical protein [Portunus trituberculatus]
MVKRSGEFNSALLHALYKAEECMNRLQPIRDETRRGVSRCFHTVDVLMGGRVSDVTCNLTNDLTATSRASRAVANPSSARQRCHRLLAGDLATVDAACAAAEPMTSSPGPGLGGLVGHGSLCSG